MDISVHYERMDHEFDRIPVSLTIFGYKVDGDDGIKLSCGLNPLKSVDYFEDTGSRIAFVEFSDISRQYHRIIGDAEIVKAIDFGKGIGANSNNPPAKPGAFTL